MLYKWQLVKDKVLKRLIGSGRKAMHHDQEEQLFNKLKEWRKEGVLVAYSHFDLTLRTPTDEKQYGNLNLIHSCLSLF